MIKNYDWKNNPTQLEYKLSELSESKIATIDSVKEFGIGNSLKYVRQTVNIERSSSAPQFLDNVSQPLFKEETLFLKILIEGEANLYLYEDGNLRRYFFKKKGADIEQLVFKKYLVEGGKIGVNEMFKQQLLVGLDGKCISVNDINRIRYFKKDLIKLFEMYYQCNGLDFVRYERKQDKELLFNLSLRPGVNYSSLSISNPLSRAWETDFGNKINFRIGMEAEFIMPFNKNKWAVIVEPTYQYFNTEALNVSGRPVKSNYKSIELPLGVRHYFFLEKGSKLFLNGSLVLDFAGKSEFVSANSSTLEIKTSYNFALGLGYKYNNRYGVELRYLTNRDMFYNYLFMRNDYQTFSVIFGYTLW
ncbi:outer membrane beta-barrel protein [Maribellus luteus]|uniref:outer membrane beta-barrel protein n=1 Tax=Maribellus luteus TaxID=2305463 RepID=UPI0019D48930|nr:outer membrane beta-barrel protein [Maribellus luteus]